MASPASSRSVADVNPDADADHMARAIAAAASVRRTTAPNPWVGCALVLADGTVVEGATQPPGGHHAEAAALAAAAPAATTPRAPPPTSRSSPAATTAAPRRAPTRCWKRA